MRIKYISIVFNNIWFLLSKNWKVVLTNKFVRKEFIRIFKQELKEFKCCLCKRGIELIKIQNDDSKIYFCNCKRDFKIFR